MKSREFIAGQPCRMACFAVAQRRRFQPSPRRSRRCDGYLKRQNRKCVSRERTIISVNCRSDRAVRHAPPPALVGQPSQQAKQVAFLVDIITILILRASADRSGHNACPCVLPSLPRGHGYMRCQVFCHSGERAAAPRAEGRQTLKDRVCGRKWTYSLLVPG